MGGCDLITESPSRPLPLSPLCLGMGGFPVHLHQVLFIIISTCHRQQQVLTKRSCSGVHLIEILKLDIDWTILKHPHFFHPHPSSCMLTTSMLPLRMLGLLMLMFSLCENPEAVTLFQSTYGAALESTYYEMQCDVDDVAPIHNLTLRWYKNNETIKTDYFTNITKRPVSESSNLTVSLNRGEKEAQFRCEAQLDFGGHASQPPVTSNVYTLSAHYAPVLKNKTEDVYLSEGEYAILNCGAEGDPAPGFRWSRDGVNLMDRTNELNISTATSAIYNCTATNYRGSTTKQIRVHVENPTPVPSTPESCPIVLIPAEIVVRFGDPTSATCNASTKDLTLMGWEATKGSKATNERVITWTVEKVDSWDEQPLCYINVKEMQCKKSLNIILYKTPDNVLVSAMDPGPMVEGREYRLNCFITNVAPLEKLKLIWYRGDETMLSRVFSSTTNTPTNVSFDLEVTPNRADNRAHFRCAAELHLGPNGPALVPTVTSSPYEAVVHYAPVFNGSNSEEEVNVISGDNVTLDCSADGNPHPEITWKSSAALNVMVTTRGRQKSIIVTEATSTNAGSYVCVARNEVGIVVKTVKLVVKGINIDLVQNT
ncbi:vascular cell adhesion protein 1-like [Anoplopoma fimbria]|uniref:vascular cell adhesion protein 1-like n=1 Tax=Anoplopoma fimbria TaxID=229290 RepID=UPI0023EAA6C0|nr:vascular cell adhesion protein 1-like [Anoplopoma fimbria]